MVTTIMGLRAVSVGFAVQAAGFVAVAAAAVANGGWPMAVALALAGVGYGTVLPSARWR